MAAQIMLPHIYRKLGVAVNANGVIFLCMRCVDSDDI
jgi:hypothetical protein